MAREFLYGRHHVRQAGRRVGDFVDVEIDRARDMPFGVFSAGVPILDAINITKETCGNEVYGRALAKVHDAIREGESMADPLRATKTCDAIVINMIDVGEETGDLDKMLMKVADNYDSDVDVLVGSLISILEPVMVVVLGVIVGFIVIALFMPMVSLIEGISGPGKK